MSPLERFIEEVRDGIRELLELVRDLVEKPIPAAPKTAVRIVLVPGTPYPSTSKGITTMANFQLTDVQTVVVAVTAVDADGQVDAVTFDAGTVLASVTDATGATSAALVATVSADQGSVSVKAATPIVGAVLTVEGSVAGKALLPGVLAFDVTTTPASQIVLTPGTPA